MFTYQYVFISDKNIHPSAVSSKIYKILLCYVFESTLNNVDQFGNLVDHQIHLIVII